MHAHTHTHIQLCNCYLIVEHQQHCALHILIPWTLHLKSIRLLSGGCPVPLHNTPTRSKTQRSALTMCTEHVHLHTTLSTEHVHLHAMLSIHNVHRTWPSPHNTQHSQYPLNMSVSTQHSAFTMHTEHDPLHTTLSIHNANWTCPFPHNAQHSQCKLNMSISKQRSALPMHTKHVHFHTTLSIHSFLLSAQSQEEIGSLDNKVYPPPPRPLPEPLIKNNHKKYKTIQSTRVYNFTLSLIRTKLTSNSGSNHPYLSKTKNKTKQKTPTCPPKK